MTKIYLVMGFEPWENETFWAVFSELEAAKAYAIENAPQKPLSVGVGEVKLDSPGSEIKWIVEYRKNRNSVERL